MSFIYKMKVAVVALLLVGLVANASAYFLWPYGGYGGHGGFGGFGYGGFGRFGGFGYGGLGGFGYGRGFGLGGFGGYGGFGGLGGFGKFGGFKGKCWWGCSLFVSSAQRLLFVLGVLQHTGVKRHF